VEPTDSREGGEEAHLDGKEKSGFTGLGTPAAAKTKELFLLGGGFLSSGKR
jgi:hypothetical protein